MHSEQGFSLNAKRIDQSSQRRGLLAATRIVKKKPGNGGHQSSNTRNSAPLAEVFRHPVFSDPGKARPVERRLDHQLEFIQEQ